MNENIQGLLGNVLAAVQPVRDSLAKIEEEITEREAELSALRTARSQAKKVLAIIDPQAAKPERKRAARGTNPERITEVIEFIRARFNGEGFSGSQVITHPEFRSELHLSNQYLHAIIKNAHEQGLIRLDHVGTERSPREKIYFLTEANDGS